MQGPGGSAQCPSPGGPDECPITPTYKEMQVLLIGFFKYLIKRCSIIQQWWMMEREIRSTSACDNDIN